MITKQPVLRGSVFNVGGYALLLRVKLLNDERLLALRSKTTGENQSITIPSNNDPNP
ncbi:hypothetical protein [Paenibacillus sp. J45TS6]|uniref:hypothetical protein n=1 Tax=Paenibacillus sp. J45TS6 TaxID=2807196 RepID=UPI001BD19992|nr:hypothetical protein [Paenibacillus sp. J45TS6]